MDQKELFATSPLREATNVPIAPDPSGIRITFTSDGHSEGMNHIDMAEILENHRTDTSSTSHGNLDDHSVDMRLSPPPFRALFDESHPIAPSPLYASMMTVTGDLGRDVGNTSPHEPPYGTLSTAGNLLPIGSLSIGTSTAIVTSIEQSIGSNSNTRGILHPSTIATIIPPFVTSGGISTATNIATPEDNSAPTSRPQSEPPELIIIEEEQIGDDQMLIVDTEQINQQLIEPIAQKIETLSDEAVDSVLPKDETSLRRIILHIQTNSALSSVEKAKKIQQLMMSRWTSKRDSGTTLNATGKILPSEEKSKSENIHGDHSQSPPWIMLATMSAPNLLHDMNSITDQSHNTAILNEVSINRINELEDKDSLTDLRNGITSHSDYIERVIRPMLTQQDLVPTIAPMHSHSQGRKFETFGCKHYTSGCKIFTPCCMKWFPCRYCHDEAMHMSTTDNDNDNDREKYSSINQHPLPRFSAQNHSIIKYIMCQNCQQIQLSSMTECTKCGLQFGSHYTCTKCAIWENDPKKRIYHCQSCQVCRIGDPDEYFHCTKCDCCLRVDLRGNHKCIEKNLHCDCPICGEYLFYSTTSIIFMPCGHAIHYLCHQKHTANSYQCPICWKSLVNMKVYFARLDQMLSEHKMPEEYASVMSNILCNDCEKRSNTSFHFMYHKCKHCGSYNTKLLSTFIHDQNSIQSHDQDIIMDTHDTNEQYSGENTSP